MALMDGTIECGFVLVRPPGHHACRVVHGARGFRNVNSCPSIIGIDRLVMVLFDRPSIDDIIAFTPEEL